ncbi:MAG TPA: Hsp20/alpha crystallin family protein [Chitinophaga sp.]|uniref:Hsp20/alpha crystallin family protein n=1 Tax=Chitinophaga sp. TaxID=1869181 RepID=UPI002BEB0345|nr:Hsp20/alpha crystallin family protein [Chitinophaga sp.]HVI47364.1 Hsp20/alpha crystallin family protein [Chitinophaga sp.]
MTHVKLFNHNPLSRNIGDILNGGWTKFVNDDFLTGDFFATHPPVNITETKDAFLVDVVAPGFSKEDIKINTDDKSLTISAERKAETKNEADKQVRREFSFRSFKRSFSIGDAVDTTKINAKYDNGILKVTLPKKENKQDSPKEIVVE